MSPINLTIVQSSLDLFYMQDRISSILETERGITLSVTGSGKAPTINHGVINNGAAYHQRWS